MLSLATRRRGITSGYLNLLIERYQWTRALTVPSLNSPWLYRLRDNFYCFLRHATIFRDTRFFSRPRFVARFYTLLNVHWWALVRIRICLRTLSRLISKGKNTFESEHSRVDFSQVDMNTNESYEKSNCRDF